MKVSISDDAGRTLALSPQRVALFEVELTRVLTVQSTPYLQNQNKVAADCNISVDNEHGTVTHYQIFGDTVLVETQTRRAWQFYFGLLIMRWLEMVPAHVFVPLSTRP
jgi:hypothetical protein